MRVVIRVVAAWCCLAVPARGQIVLTMEEVATRARAQAAAVTVARARTAEAEAGLLDATARFRENPLVEVSAGPRRGGNSTTDIDIGVSQALESGSRRRARIAGAQAAVDRQRADVAETTARAVADAGELFLRALAAAERERTFADTDGLSRQLLAATERRYAAGDVAAIDLNLARIDAARAAAALRAARSDAEAARDRLRALLRLPAAETLELKGSLDSTAPPPIGQLEAAIERRPEFAALDAEAREASAGVQFGRALAGPVLGFRVAYEREDADSIVLGGLSVSLPAFQRGQATLAAGLARETRVRLEREAVREAALAELRAAYADYQRRAELVAALVRDALPPVEDNERLAQRAYEAGEMNLLDLLLVRRDAVDTRAVLIDRRLEAAQRRLAVDVAAGVLR
jgi:cobalt-zinc-cadmium efflux system outer membrane protein